MREIADQVEIDKRIHEISLLLKRKSTGYIVQYCSQKWNVSERQIRTYIKRARKEWQKYFTNIKHAGIGYHIAQMKEIKDQAYERKIVIGKGENKQVIEVPDLSLVFDIAKEEAKLMGSYPAEKKQVDLGGNFNITYKEIIYEEEKPDDGS